VLAYAIVFLALPLLVYGLSYFRYNSIPHCNALTGAGLETPAICSSSHPEPLALTLRPVQVAGAGIWVPTALDPGRYIRQIVIHDQWAYDYHAHLTATHPYGSKWYTWPFLVRPVAYYYQDGLGYDSLKHAPLREEVFNLGNPAIWWAAIPALIYCVAVAIRRRHYPAIFIVIAFAAAYLPFSRVTRVMFLYHMFGSLPLMILAVSYALADLRRWVTDRTLGALRLHVPTGGLLAAAYLGTVIVIFVYFYPLWTALPVSGESWNQRIWFNVPADNRFLHIQPDTRISWI
jgi:dolichyl-phosphate-mannose--protein O-mannosyl transferase